MFARVVLTTLSLMFAALSGAAQTSDRTVALVISVGEGGARADAVQTQLQLMGAETLRAADPNNAELRSILKRFAREAEDSRATFVYLDAPAVIFEGRDYVLPAGATLGRSTDLFTQAIPTLAFARSAALSEQGGAVVLTVTAPPSGLPGGISKVERAPDPVAGAAAVVVAGIGAFGPVLTVLEAAARQEEVELGTILRGMFTKDGVTLSDLPSNRILLRAAPELAADPEPAPVATPAATPEPVAAPQPVAEPEPVVEATATPELPAETIDELRILEQSLSRSAKRGIQRELRAGGFYRGLVDGIFGPQTREAITDFQQSRSEEATGVLNRRQLLDLRS